MSKALMAAASLYNDQRFLSKSELRIYRNKIRRQRIVRRQRITLAMIIAMFLFAMIFVVSTLVSAAASDDYTPEYKYYGSITVGVGDTLWDIASDNISWTHYDTVEDYISEICSINHVEEEEIFAGDNLVIPYYSTEFK